MHFKNIITFCLRDLVLRKLLLYSMSALSSEQFKKQMLMFQSNEKEISLKWWNKVCFVERKLYERLSPSPDQWVLLNPTSPSPFPYQPRVKASDLEITRGRGRRVNIKFILKKAQANKKCENTYSFQTSVGRHAHPWENLPNAWDTQHELLT